MIHEFKTEPGPWPAIKLAHDGMETQILAQSWIHLNRIHEIQLRFFVNTTSVINASQEIELKISSFPLIK